MSNTSKKFGGFFISPAAVLLLFMMSPALFSQGLKAYEKKLQKLAEKGRKATVEITATVQWKNPSSKTKEQGFSTTFSGVLTRPDGYITTVAKPVRKAEDLYVRRNNTRHEANVVGVDSVSGLALLKIDQTDLPYLPPSEKETVKPGSVAIVVGNAFGFDGSVSSGIVSGINRSLRLQGEWRTGLLQMTAPVNPGGQGGPVLNSDGKLMGIVTGTYQRRPPFRKRGAVLKKLLKKMPRENIMKWFKRRWKQKHPEKPPSEQLLETVRAVVDKMKREMDEVEVSDQDLSSFLGGHLMSSEGVHFAIPAHTIRRITEQLRKHGTVTRGWIGVYLQTPKRTRRPAHEENGPSGFEIIKVNPDGPAEKAGLKKGDEILSVSGKNVRNLGTLKQTISRTRPGKTVKVTVRRDGEQITVPVKLAPHPSTETD